MLKIQGLKKKFGNFEALSGLDMKVEEGALYGFVGPNGAGKTTAIRIITGLLKADEGTVMIGGKDAFLYSGQVKNEFGYVPDEFGLYDNLKVWEYMDFFASCYGLSGLVARERCTKLLEQVKLAGLPPQLPAHQSLCGQPVQGNETETLPGAGHDPRSEAPCFRRAHIRHGSESQDRV